MVCGSSILGRIGGGAHGVCVLGLDGKLFPYQELRRSVLVWHATCIRRGQKNREEGFGNRELGTESRE